MNNHLFDPHALSMLTYAMNPPWLVRELDEAFDVPITEDTSRELRAHLSTPEGEIEWRGRFEPSFG